MKKLILFFFMIINFSCERYPKSETIIEGRVLDSFGKPIKSLEINFRGTYQKNIQKRYTTFNVETKTDSNGKYIFNKKIVKSTNQVTINLGAIKPIINFEIDSILVIRNNKDIIRGVSPSIKKENFGTTTIFDFKVYYK
jgi:hypothetical protein